MQIDQAYRQHRYVEDTEFPQDTRSTDGLVDIAHIGSDGIDQGGNGNEPHHGDGFIPVRTQPSCQHRDRDHDGELAEAERHLVPARRLECLPGEPPCGICGIVPGAGLVLIHVPPYLPS